MAVVAVNAALLALVVVVVELVGRVFYADALTLVDEKKYMFVTSPGFVERDGYFNYPADTTIREVQYFPDQAGRLTIEYDCTYRSDSLGFLENATTPADADILLLGDSFAAGTGGCSWFREVAPAIRTRVYSAALLGTGMRDWWAIYSDLSSRRRPRHVVLLFIDPDFYRSVQVFSPGQLDCLKSLARCGDHFWYPVTADMPAVARARYERRTARPARGSIKQTVKNALPTTYAIYVAWSKAVLERQPPPEREVPPAVLARLREMNSEVRLTLVRINMLDEAVSGVPQPAYRAAVPALRVALGIEPRRCAIPADGFLVRDGHPNGRGYAVLRSCVETILAELLDSIDRK